MQGSFRVRFSLMSSSASLPLGADGVERVSTSEESEEAKPCTENTSTDQNPKSSQPVSKTERPASDAKADKPKLPRPTGTEPCPRCGSKQTKFCYYNNYNINQPRYYCKSCQRYWTAGGNLRDVPVGAGRRKSKSAKQEANESVPGFPPAIAAFPGMPGVVSSIGSALPLHAPKHMNPVMHPVMTGNLPQNVPPSLAYMPPRGMGVPPFFNIPTDMMTKEVGGYLPVDQMPQLNMDNGVKRNASAIEDQQNHGVPGEAEGRSNSSTRQVKQKTGQKEEIRAPLTTMATLPMALPVPMQMSFRPQEGSNYGPGRGPSFGLPGFWSMAGFPSAWTYGGGRFPPMAGAPSIVDQPVDPQGPVRGGMGSLYSSGMPWIGMTAWPNGIPFGMTPVAIDGAIPMMNELQLGAQGMPNNAVNHQNGS